MYKYVHLPWLFPISRIPYRHNRNLHRQARSKQENMKHSPAKVIFGGGVFVTSTDEFSKPENISQVLAAVEKHGITTIDTAKSYANCEQVLGQVNATARFTVDTKFPGGMNKELSTKDVVVASGQESLQSLNTKSVRISCGKVLIGLESYSCEAIQTNEKHRLMYTISVSNSFHFLTKYHFILQNWKLGNKHCQSISLFPKHSKIPSSRQWPRLTTIADVPDVRLPLEETLEGINTLYKAGAFRRFGLSNFSIAMVEEVIRITQERGFVRPSVYQGIYNAVTRRTEGSLLPLLRKHNIAFYAYSPIAGGFLAKRPEDLAGGAGTGRWDPKSPFGSSMYRFLSSPFRGYA